MIKISAADLQRDFEYYEHVASRQPVAVTRDGRDSCVLISTDEYHRLKSRDRQVLAIEDFTEADAAAVERAEPSPEAASYDGEIVSTA